ncbi:sulfite exporter TauE/SafE family protein [Penaeicola halotolerans]|uniref:sulfite exporter TauE/SafE family protein n=1 Tax=Penaeicola halotolerans TaxID=2793196 RepID=UPI001CF8C01C|nr:sulfite exporter TauE/SafE family protein [Penaeicola halotolerans]
MALKSLILFALLALIAEILGTIGGFGSSMLFVPLAQFFFDFQTVLGITALFHVFSNSAKLILFFKHIDWKISWTLGIPAVVFVSIGAILTNLIELYWAKVALGAFLIAMGTLFLVKPNLTFQPSTKNTLLGGTISGFLAGLVGTGGAIRGLTLAAFSLSKNAFIATSSAIDFGVDLSRSIIYLSQGYLDRSHLYYFPTLIIIAFLGSWIGKKILQYIPEMLFKKIVLVLIVLLGMVTLYQSLTENIP